MAWLRVSRAMRPGASGAGRGAAGGAGRRGGPPASPAEHATAAGSSTGRTIRASSATAIAIPTPNWRTLIRSLKANGSAAATITAAAPVAMAAVGAARKQRRAGVAGLDEALARARQQQHLVDDRDAEDRREDPDDRHRVEVAGAAEERVVAAEQQRHRAERGRGVEQVEGDRDERQQRCGQRDHQHQRDGERERRRRRAAAGRWSRW